VAEREVKIVITGEDRTKKALASAAKGFQGFNQKIGGFVAGAVKALAKVGVAAAVGIGAIAVVSVKTAIEVESAFAGIIKTTDGLVDEFGALNEVGEQVRAEFRRLALTIPTNLPDLMRVGELGGQLGIASENLVDFTEVMAAMGEATNLTREEAATAFAQIANIMGTAQTDFDRMGSSVVALGNNFATTEADIVNFATRIAATGRIAGLAEADVFGIAAAFTSVGVQAEAGGTAVQKVLTAMTIAVADGGDQLDIFADTAGMSADEFAAAFKVDAAGAFTDFVEGLGEQGDEAFGTLEALELQDQRLIRAFLSLAGAGDLLGQTIAESNQAWDENTALAKEAEARYRTTESQLAILKNTVKDVATSLGDALIPFLRETLEVARPFIAEFAEKLPEFLETKLIPALKDVIGGISDVVKAVGGFIADLKAGEDPMGAFSKLLLQLVPVEVSAKILEITQKIVDLIGSVSTFVTEHAPALKAAFIAIGAAIAIASIASAVAGIIAAINPITLVIVAIGLAVGILAEAWTKNWATFRARSPQSGQSSNPSSRMSSSGSRRTSPSPWKR